MCPWTNTLLICRHIVVVDLRSDKNTSLPPIAQEIVCDFPPSLCSFATSSEVLSARSPFCCLCMLPSHRPGISAHGAGKIPRAWGQPLRLWAKSTVGDIPNSTSMENSLGVLPGVAKFDGPGRQISPRKQICCLLLGIFSICTRRFRVNLMEWQ